MKNKIRQIRKAKRLTLEQVAQAAGTSNQMIGMLERGDRTLSVDWLERIAPVLGVSAVELLDHDEERKIPVVGYAGAGFRILPIDDHMKGAGLDYIDAPPGLASRSAVAVIVRGYSMIPVLEEGDVIYYDEKTEGNFDSLIGRLCVVQCDDGATYVKQIKKSGDHYWLHSHNADPVFPEGISWAARVLWVKKQ
jgi:transcriptional regulator with XRE-family HTH domain